MLSHVSLIKVFKCIENTARGSFGLADDANRGIIL
jgi:hypothetical protein